MKITTIQNLSKTHHIDLNIESKLDKKINPRSNFDSLFDTLSLITKIPSLFLGSNILLIFFVNVNVATEYPIIITKFTNLYLW